MVSLGFWSAERKEERGTVLPAQRSLDAPGVTDKLATVWEAFVECLFFLPLFLGLANNINQHKSLLFCLTQGCATGSPGSATVFA
jgi:hypothetical protein